MQQNATCIYMRRVSTKLKMPHTRVPTPTKYGVKSNTKYKQLCCSLKIGAKFKSKSIVQKGEINNINNSLCIAT